MLSDENKRQVYDLHGADGVKQYEGMTNINVGVCLFLGSGSGPRVQ